MPLIIWLHGLGANGSDLQPVADILQQNLGANLQVESIFPNAPVRPITLNGGMMMPGWYDITGLTLEAREDKPGIQKSMEFIHDLITTQINNGYKSHEIYLAGFSQGGALAMYSGLNYSQNLAGIIALSAYLPLAKHVAPVQSNDTPIFIGYGLHDTVVHPAWSELMCQWLKQAKYANLAAKIYPIEHNISLEEIQDLSSWILNN